MTIRDPLYQLTYSTLPTRPVSTFKQTPPRDIFRIDYDMMDWENPWTGTVTTPAWLVNEQVQWLFLHHGGGRNAAGDLVEEPALTWKQKLALHLGIVRGVLRSWEQWHVQGKGNRGVAYDAFITQYGRYIRGRGWRANGGQWGNTPNRWNNTSFAVNWVGGEGQTMSQAAWRMLGRVWVEASFGLPKGRALKVRPHNYTNLDSPATSCPGAERTRLVHAEEFKRTLGVLRVRKIPMRRQTVRTLTRGLVLAGFYGRVQGRYTRQVAAAVKMFQQDAGVTVDGVVGPVTWQRLAENATVL